MRVLFMCTANSCRSILSEAVLNYLAPPSFEACSTGSQSNGRVHPRSLAILEQVGIITHGLYSKGSEAFEDAPPDIAITVCDATVGEACPLYLGAALKAHWGLADPSALNGGETLRDAAFRATLARIEQRCRAFLGLPFATLGHDQLRRELERVGSL